MIAQQVVSIVAISALASACAPELYKRDGNHPAHIQKRQHIPNVVADSRGWTFDHSEEWNTQNPAWGACFAGTRQSPIDLQTSWGFSSSQPPVFNYPKALTGTVNNWDFGPQFAVDVAADNTTEASIQFDHDGVHETAYFRSWHTHAPAEHLIDGYAPRGELHYVHYDDTGNPRAVVGFFVDQATAENPSTGSTFFQQLESLSLPTIYAANATISDVTLDLNLAVAEADQYKNFWTYKGSLTTPPCLEGLRWFVSKDVIYLSDAQLESLLSVSTFSARPVNRVWHHDVNVVRTTGAASESLLHIDLSIGE